MSIHNRNLGETEQRKALNFSLGNAAFSQGETGVLAFVPFPCVLQAANIATMSLDGSPNLILTCSRFIVGAGVTTFSIGSTFSLSAFGTSGVLTSGISLPAVGDSTLNLMANDVLGYQVGSGSTLGAFGVAGCFVVKPLQDVKRFLGGLV